VPILLVEGLNMLEFWTIRSTMRDGSQRVTGLSAMLEKLGLPLALGRAETLEVQGIIDTLAQRFTKTVDYIEAWYDGNVLLSTRRA